MIGDHGRSRETASADPAEVAPIVMMLSLWSAGQATFWTLLTAHTFLRKTGRASLAAYALGGAVAGGLLTFAGQITGLDSSRASLVSAMGVAGCAGFYYRLLAGAKPVR